MKHFITTSIVSALMLIMFSNLGWGQTTIFSENIGTPSGTTLITLYTGWQNNGTLTFSGTGDVRTSTASTGYTGASGSGNVFLTNNGTSSFQIASIVTSGYTSLTLSFGAYKSTTLSNMSELKLEYSTDGTNYSTITIPTQPTGTGTANWRLISISMPAATENIGNLRIKWTNTSTTPQFRLDDIKLTGSVTAPNTQTSNIVFSLVSTSSMTIGWTNGNGSTRAVFVKEGSGSITNPSDGSTYTASNDWNTKGTQLGSSGYYCVYNGTSSTVSLSNLASGTTYYVQAFEFNGTGSSTKYLTTTATGNPNSQTTSNPSTPTISIVSSLNDFGNVTVNTNSTIQNYTVSGSNLTGDIVITPPTGFQISTTNSPFTPANPVTLTQTGGTVNSTTIYVMFSPTNVSAYSNNITHTSTGTSNPSITVSGTGISPSNPATFTANSTNQTEINLAATSNANNNSIVVVYNGTGTFSTPTDGLAPGNTGDPFANGTIVYKGDATSLDKHIGLTPGTIYYYKAFSYDTYNFYSAGATAKDTTLKYAPTVQASNITFTSVGNTSMTINWTNGDGDRRIVIINTVNSFTNPVDGTSPSASSIYSGSGEQTVYNYTSNSVTVTGLTPGTEYWFRVFEVNNYESNTLYLTSSATNNPYAQFTNTPTAFFEDFEIGTKGSYAIGSVTCKMGSWTMDEALIGDMAGDKKNGLQSVRMRNANGSITMDFDLNKGARDVTIYSAIYSNDAASTWKLQKSTNGGTSWSDASDTITATSTLTATTVSVKQPGTVRFRIYHITGGSSARLNIDDISITDYDKTVTTTSSLPLTEYGNLTINGTGINVTLSGSTVLNGNLNMTNGSLVIGSNTLTLNGSATGTGTITGSSTSDLVIGGTGNMGTIYFTPGSEVLGNLTMNRTSSGSVTIGSNLNVNTGLTLTSGIINMGANTLTLGTSILSLGSLTIADIGSNASYITGNFERWMPAGVSGDVYFPVGTTNAYRPAIINYTNNKSSGGKLMVSGNDTDPGTVNPGASLLDDAYTVDRYSKQAWWKFTTSTITGGMYDISLGAFAIDGVSQPNFGLLRLMKRADNTSNWSFSGTHSNATGTYSLPFVKRTGISNGFSEFGISGYSIDGNTLSNAPLPVHLSSFTSSANRRNITLNWTTASENNNSGFDVERKSADGSNWVKAGFVTGSGTTASASNYSFTDRNLNSGKYKYRLKQIDYNGNYEYFELNGTPEVGVPDKYNISQNYPNPFNPTTKIDLDIPFDSKVSLVLYDMAGREVRSLIGNEMKAGYYTHLFDASSLSSGIYFYRVVMNSGKASFVQSKKMVLIK